MESSNPQELAKQAKSAYQSRQYLEAAQLFESAANLYTSLGDAINAAEMASNRSVSLLQAGDAKGALMALSGVEQVFEQAGDTRRQAVVVGNEAAALEAMNLIKPALEKYKHCSELLKQAGDTEARAVVLKTISQLQMRSGHQLEALATMDAALEQQKNLSLKERFLKKLLKIPFQMMNRGG